MRAAWVLLALAAGGGIGDALDGRTTAVRFVAAIGLWFGWGAGVVALFVPRSTSLTAARILVPAGLAAMLAGTLAGGTPNGADAIAVLLATVATVAVLMPWVGETWVEGSAYGNERRLPLRPPVIVATVLAPLTWLVVVAGASVGPLVLASGAWAPGVIITALGWGAAFIGVRSLHQLSRRWLVLVPAGVVLHDPMTMPEPQLFLRRMITRLGPAVDGATGAAGATSANSAEDLTAGAAGLTLSLELSEPVDLLVRRGRRDSVTKVATAVLFTPTRPGRVLDGAAAGRVAVG